MKIEIEVTNKQHAAIVVIAKKMRMSTSETAKLLAFMAVNMDYGDLTNFRDFADDVLAIFDDDEDWRDRNGGIAGCIPVEEVAHA